MALVPPPNTAGVVPPANPQHPPTLGDITNSKEYVERLALSKQFQIPGATATNDDIGAAERYHQEIVLTNTIMGATPPPWFAQLTVGAAPPPWLAQFIGNVDQNFNQMHADVNQMRADVNQMRADVNQIRTEMQAGFARIEARQVNAGIARLNRLEMESNSGLIAYQAKQKAVAGDGTPLANALLVVGVAPLAALPVVPAVGTTIAATISPNGLTHQAILNMIQFYNIDFGIQPNEVLLAVRWQRVLNWLTTDI